MLSDGFGDELKEIISACPTARQTMLFSASMTNNVDALVRMSLHRPLRLFIDPKRSTTRGLLRASRKGERTLGSACGPLQADMQTRCDHLLQEQETRAGKQKSRTET